MYDALCDYRERTGDSLKLKRFEAPTSVENLAHQLFSEISAMGFNLDRLEVQETDIAYSLGVLAQYAKALQLVRTSGAIDLNSFRFGM